MDPEQDDGWLTDDPADEAAGADAQPQNAVPEGRRVIRQQRKGNSPRETLYLKRREIVRETDFAETEDGEEDGPEPLTVRQGTKRGKEARQSDAPMEDRWGSTRYRRRGTKWILFVVLLVAAPLIAVIVYVSISGSSGVTVSPIAGGGGSMFDVPDGPSLAYDPTTPEAWFHKNSVEAFSDGIEILSKINVVENPDDLAKDLRDAERTLPAVKAGWGEKKSDFFVDDPRALTWEYGGAGDTGFMAISGRLLNHESFRAYFVKTDNGLKLDWKATTAWSPISVGDLVVEAPKQPTLVRGWLGKQPDYDMFEGHGSLYSWYQVLDPKKEEFVWAYVPAGSKRDEKLKKLLNYGMIVMERKDEVRAIVRVVKPTLGFRETEFEILEVLAKDWVMP